MIEITLAELSVAEHALREEPYERLPCLAGTIAVAQSQIENFRQESKRLLKEKESLRQVAERVIEIFRPMQDKGNNGHTFELLLLRAERALEGLEK
jgi:hypothetical protein